jgi:hypothetical protein
MIEALPCFGASRRSLHAAYTSSQQLAQSESIDAFAADREECWEPLLQWLRQPSALVVGDCSGPARGG